MGSNKLKNFSMLCLISGVIIIGIGIILSNFIPKERPVTEEEILKVIENTDLGNTLDYTFVWKDKISIPYDNTSCDFLIDNISSGSFTYEGDYSHVFIDSSIDFQIIDNGIKDGATNEKGITETYMVKKDNNYLKYEYDSNNDVWYYTQEEMPDEEPEAIIYDDLTDFLVNNTLINEKAVKKENTDLYECKCTFDMSDPYLQAFLNNNSANMTDDSFVGLINTLAGFGDNIKCTLVFYITKDFSLYKDDISFYLTDSNTPYIMTELFIPYDIYTDNMTHNTEKFVVTINNHNEEIEDVPKDIVDNALSLYDYLIKYSSYDKKDIDALFGYETEEIEEQSNPLNKDDIFNDLMDNTGDNTDNEESTNLTDNEQIELQNAFLDYMESAQ